MEIWQGPSEPPVLQCVNNCNIKMKTMMSVTESYLEKCSGIIEKIRAQQPDIQKAAKWFAESILE